MTGTCMTTGSKWWARAGVALFAVLGLAGAATAQGGASLTSDAADYPPGATATLTGAGFAGGETVTVQVVHADGAPTTGADHEPWNVFADSNGGFVTTWHVCEDDCVGELLLATADQASGAHAETTFTDSCTSDVTVTGGPTSFTFSGGSPFSNVGTWHVVPGVNYTVTIANVNCAGDDITVSYQNNGNCYSFNATRVGATNSFSGTMVFGGSGANCVCATGPITYVCGANQPCSNQGFNPQGNCQQSVHFGASTDGTQDGDISCPCQTCTPCTLTPPSNVTVNCGASTDPSNTGTPTGCQNATPSDAVTSGNCAGNYTLTRTWSAPDGCGGTATCVQSITVTDTTGPVLSGVPADTGADCASVPEAATVTATDNCSSIPLGVVYNETRADGNCDGNYTLTRTWTAIDQCGNTTSDSQTINVTDTTPPTITCPENKTVSGAGACCVENVNLGEPEVSDDCSEIVLTRIPAESTFCVGDTIVTWTATDECGNPSTCTQTVTVKGQICATKYYDANANGVRDNGEVGVPGWQIVVTGTASFSGTTGSDGTVCFDAPAGTYTVSEGTPTQTNWVHTTPTSCTDVTVSAANCNPSCAFGNYCFSPPSNGFTIGYWTNANGKKVLDQNPGWVALLNGLGCLRNANGTIHTFSTVADLKNWLNGATATNMAYMLSAQLAANVLDGAYKGLNGATSVVVPGGVKTNANVCMVPYLSVTQAISCGSPPLLALTSVSGSTACGCTSNDGLVTIADLRTRACCLLGSYGNTTASGVPRTYQECVKDILDMINNNGNPTGSSAYPCGGVSQYINSGPGSCPVTFP